MEDSPYRVMARLASGLAGGARPGLSLLRGARLVGGILGVCLAAASIPGATAPLRAQSPDSAAAAVAAAERAAAADRHAEAIALYERAMEADPSLEPVLRSPLALQYLWSDRPVRAAELLGRHLEAEPGDCDARQHYALALSWADRLNRALDEYRAVRDRCPALRVEAMMGEARVLLWRSEVRAAESLYERVLEVGTPEQRLQARIGMANAALATFEPRRARRILRELHDQGARATGVLEGLAQAALESGRIAEAREVLDEAEAMGVSTGALERVREEIAIRERPAVRLSPYGFRDADGTSRQGIEGVVEAGRDGLSLEAALGRSRLSGRSVVDGWHARATGSYRWGAALGVAGTLGAHHFDSGAFSPVTGDIHVAWTPTDLRRVDLSAARLIVPDNVAALRQGLTGMFVGVGMDEGITRWTSMAAGVDLTRWSPGNVRTRARLSLRHRFSGVPMVTVEWPTLYQRYSEPFDFLFFSPPVYWETGPGMDIYRRLRRVWHLNAYVRGGAQRESGGDWSPLGMGRLSVERELRRAWGVRVELGWSNSNLTGSSGFERTSGSVSIGRRF